MPDRECSLEQLGLHPDDISALKQCMTVTAFSDLYDDWEFQLLFGFTREEAKELATDCVSDKRINSEVGLFINNAIVNAAGYPHSESERQRLGAPDGGFPALHERVSRLLKPLLDGA